MSLFVPPVIRLLLTANIASWLPARLTVRVLVGANMTLTTTQYLNVSDCYLVMQPDCNAILYNHSQPLLWTNYYSTRQHEGKCSIIMQVDGNFVIYKDYTLTNYSTAAIFDSMTDTRNDSKTYKYLLLRGDGSYNYYDYNSRLIDAYNPFVPYAPLLSAPSPAPESANRTGGSLVIPSIAYPFPPQLAWKPYKPLDGFPYMPAEYFLSQGSKLQTVAQPVEHQFVLVLRSDSNLQFKEILTNGSERVVWQSRTNSSEVRHCQLILQQDGRLQIRNNVSGNVYWNTTVTGNLSVGWVLELRLSKIVGVISIEDIEDPSTVLWSTIDPNQAYPASSTSKITTVWIVVGVVSGASVLAIAGLALLYFYSRTSILEPAEKAFRRRLEFSGGKSQTLYSESKIKQATNNFGNSIGSGGFGDVCYGKLPDGQEIAAKVLSAESHQSKQEFYNEIELLSVVHHKYLVSLLGYRCTRKHQILIYEYMSGGDLRHRLQGESAAENSLSWRQRTSIAIQIAEGC